MSLNPCPRYRTLNTGDSLAPLEAIHMQVSNDGQPCTVSAGNGRSSHSDFRLVAFDDLKHASLRYLPMQYLVLSSAVSSTSVSYRDPLFP